MRRLVFFALTLACAGVPFACGARTNLDERNNDIPDAMRGDESDASVNLDAVVDVTFENSPLVRDGLPPFDGFPDVIPSGCDGGQTLVYLLTQSSTLVAFDPSTLSFSTVGNVTCSTTTAPYSMAVDRIGHAYSVFDDGHLFRIDTGDASCSTTPYAPENYGSPMFGMGYANVADAGDTLFVATNGSFQAHGLATIDTATFALDAIADFQPTIRPCELTGTGDGRLFGFYVNNGPGSHLVELDKANAQVIADVALAVGTSSTTAFAFAFWGGSFWIFVSDNGAPSVVTRFNLATFPHETTATTFTDVVVGAGVSTCAPE